jgi:hypothetical protein
MSPPRLSVGHLRAAMRPLYPLEVPNFFSLSKPAERATAMLRVWSV